MSMPRDGGDPEEEAPARQRGRAVPEAESSLVDLRVNGVVVGTVDTRTLKARALFDLERTATGLGLITWLERYAGLTPEDRPAVEDEIGEMTVSALVDLAQAISEAIGKGMQLPNASRRASARR